MPQTATDSRIFLLPLNQRAIHTREDGYINVCDLERYIPVASRHQKSWVKFLAESYHTLGTLARRNGIPSGEMIQAETTADGERFIWAQFDFALSFAAYIDPELHADMVITYRRVRTGEIFSEDEPSGQGHGGALQQWLRARQKLRQHTPIRNLAIKKHQGQGWIYRYCADGLNQATTGHTGKEICSITHVKDTRDALDTSHLALQLLGESEQIKAMDTKQAQGNAEIQRAVDPVHRSIEDIAIHFNLHDDRLLYDRTRLLHGGASQTPALGESSPSSDYPCRDYHDTGLSKPDGTWEIPHPTFS
jgi:hypothetical protein